MNCFDLNELPLEGILFYFIYISFIIEYDVDFYYFFNHCYNIEQMNDIVIASEIYQSVDSRQWQSQEFRSGDKIKRQD